MSTVPQAFIFDIKHHDTVSARAWLARNGYKAIKRVHKTKNYLRYRIREPDPKARYTTKAVDKGVLMVGMI